MKRSESPIIPLYPADEHEADDDPLNFLAPLPSRSSPQHSLRQQRSNKKVNQSDTTSQIKSAQSIQTPSASPRHFSQKEQPPPPPLASTSTSTPHQTSTNSNSTKRRRTSSLVFRNDKDTEEMTPRRERMLRRKNKVDDMKEEETTSGQRQEPAERRESLMMQSRRGEREKQKGRQSETRNAEEGDRRKGLMSQFDATISESVVKSKRDTNDTRQRQLEREEIEIERVMRLEEAEPQAEEQDVIKVEEQYGDDYNDGAVSIKAEEVEEEGEEYGHFDAEEEEESRHHDDFEDDRAVNAQGRVQSPYKARSISPRRRQRPANDFHRAAALSRPQESAAPFQPPTPHANASTPSPVPTLSYFIHSLDLPRMSRLIEPFHEVGIETPEDLLALASTTTAGKRRRDLVLVAVGEIERERGGEFTRFEQVTIKIGLEESRRNWGL